MTRSNARRGALSAVAAAGAIALGLGVAAPASATLNDDGSITVDLLNITDFHGALPTAPNIAQQVAAIRAANPDTVFSSAGDSIGGSTFESAVAQDVPTLDLLDEAGLEVSAVGNHEFDQGFADLTERVQPLVDFPYLGANVIDEATGEPALPPFEIITTDSGLRVGYVGTVTESTPTIVSPAGIEGLEFTDPIAATNEWAALLSDGIDTPDNPEADIVVALVHEGTAVVASGLSDDVDAAFTGHSHETTSATTPSGAPVVQAGASGNVLARIQLTVANDGEVTTVTTVSAANLPVTEMTEEQIESTEPLPAETFDAESVAIVRAAYEDAAELGDEEIGTIGAPFNAASRNNTPNTGTPSNRGAESPLGNLIAEIALETVNEFGLDADFGIMNPGGLRADLDPNADGIVTFREAFNVTSFSNTIGTIDLTGEQVVTLLEQQFDPRPPRPMLALGLSPQLSYIYDPAAPVGARVVAVFLNGAPIDPAGTYRVASNTFLLDGADGFTVLGEGTNLQESGVVDWQATANFLGRPENVGLVPTYLQQSVGVTEVTSLDQVFAPGDEITVALSSLSFTSTEPNPTEVVATVAPETASAPGIELDSSYADAVPAAAPGTVLAEVPVDNTVVLVPSIPVDGAPVPQPDNGQGSNETGRATVTITIPEDTEGDLFTVRYATEVIGESGGVATEWVDVTVAVAADDVPPTEEPEPSQPAPSQPGTSPSAPPAAGGAGGSLPQTGAELAGPAVALAALLLAIGLGLVVRRRRSA
ncbi:bifunctional metallophosphatase/5'-nucleotidase [Agrococcus sp. SGAir0287]|uniref:bifunctional metallophosphatase/5'-nucleotidase n=1 Tax=Agrococcus sp. SGAir0287 TaxID=2070347 RepID=UPI0015864D0F|nr:5'-nucleotidase C-terminal domain-containing protein [Agrococcus sp. SGAir0287]